MLFNLSILLLSAVGFTAALPVPDQDEPVTVSRGARQAAGLKKLVQRSEVLVNRVVKEEIVVYIDASGHPLSTSTIVGAPVTVATAGPVPQTNNRVEQNNAPAPSSPSSPVPSPPPSSNNLLGPASSTGSPFQNGVIYSPQKFNGTRVCKTSEEISKDLQFLIGKGHDLIRLYGVECDGVAHLQAAVKGKPIWMFLGLFVPEAATADAIETDRQLGNDWTQVHTLSVGNEVVFKGGNLEHIIGIMNGVRQQVRNFGYQGPVVTTDVAGVVENNPKLCTEADYCAVNLHAFFDHNPADKAADTITFHRDALKAATGLSKIVVTESGWPTCGDANLLAVPGEAQQKTAISRIKSVSDVDIIVLSSFNDYWKDDFDGSFHAEKCWGIYGDSPK